MATAKHTGSPRSQIMAIGLCLFFLASLSDGLAISYCSPENTGSSYPAYFSNYMSNGLCQSVCQESYAYAVIQGSYCWCSDYAPADQTNTLNCNQVCPGYGYEWCGSTSAGLFGYYALGITPSGTAGGTSSSIRESVSTAPETSGTPSTLPSSAATFVPSVVTKTSLVTVTAPQSSVQTRVSTIVSYATVPSQVSSSLTSATFSQTYVSDTTSAAAAATTSESAAQSSNTPYPTEAFTSVTTVTGQIRTIIITPSATADPTLGQGATTNGGVNKGTVVGIVVGCALGLGVVIGLVVFFWLRRKHANSVRSMSPDGHHYNRDPVLDPGRTPPSRQVSQLSSSTLLARAPTLQTKGLGPSNTVRSADTSSTGFDRRSVGTDQRLNPHALFIHDEGAYSNLSLQDNQDYSRQLRIANPDPDA